MARIYAENDVSLNADRSVVYIRNERKINSRYRGNAKRKTHPPPH